MKIVWGINDIIREEIYKDDCDTLLDSLNRVSDKKQEIIYRLMINDAYLVLKADSNKEQIEKDLYELISNTDVEDLIEILKSKPNYFKLIHFYAFKFYDLPIIDKCLLNFLKLEARDCDRNIELNKGYLVDLIIYTLNKDIESINYYYQDIIARKGLCDQEISHFYSTIYMMMDELKQEDTDMFNDNFLDILRGFYINHLLITKYIPDIPTKGSEISYMLEKEDLSAVKDLLLKEPDKFIYVLSQYLFFINDEELYDNEELNDLIDYEISPQMVKKLHIEQFYK